MRWPTAYLTVTINPLHVSLSSLPPSISPYNAPEPRSDPAAWTPLVCRASRGVETGWRNVLSYQPVALSLCGLPRYVNIIAGSAYANGPLACLGSGLQTGVLSVSNPCPKGRAGACSLCSGRVPRGTSLCARPGLRSARRDGSDRAPDGCSASRRFLTPIRTVSLELGVLQSPVATARGPTRAVAEGTGAAPLGFYASMTRQWKVVAAARTVAVASWTVLVATWAVAAGS